MSDANIRMGTNATNLQGVTVVAVTKTLPVERILEGVEVGITHFGENYMEEARMKLSIVSKTAGKPLIWHMIGHVQSRKAKEVVELFDWVDSVDSIALLARLNRYAKGLGKTLHVLLEVNLTGEKTKYGFDLAGWENNSEKLKCFDVLEHENISLPNVVIVGLMVMPPQVSDPEENRPTFRSAKRLFDEIGRRLKSASTDRSSEVHFASWKHLSMGTSQDYKVALEEGATMVRLGTAFFGPRLSK